MDRERLRAERELIADSGLFDWGYYLSSNPDIAIPGLDPVLHFLFHGGFEGRRPHPLFDPAFYLRNNPDVAAAGVNPFVHFLAVGAAEGRDPSPEFSSRGFLERHPGLDAGTNPLLLYVRESDPRSLFDAAHYTRIYPDVARSEFDPLRHYLEFGVAEGRDPHPLFSTSFYAASAQVPAGENPLLHFLRVGGSSGISPHPFFDSLYYLDHQPHVRRSGRNPLVHYLERGASEGAWPNPWFDGDFYRRLYRDVGSQNPLVHYVLFGEAEGRHTHRGGSDPALVERDRLVLHAVAARRRRQAIEDFQPVPPAMLSVPEEEVVPTAAALEMPRAPEPAVSIVIPVFGNLRLTVECLVSISRAGAAVPYEVVVVDDASTDDTPRVLSHVPGIRYVRMDRNRGFVAACNRGAKEACAPLLLFLNNDVQVLPGWLEALVAGLSAAPDTGAVGPRVLSEDGRLQEAGARVHPDGVTKFLGVLADPSAPAFSEPRRVDYCSGVCLLLRRTEFERLSGFDEAYTPCYCEDVDLCLRLQEGGLSVRCHPDAVIVHRLSSTTRLLGDDRKRRWLQRNRRTLAERRAGILESLNRVTLVATWESAAEGAELSGAWKRARRSGIAALCHRVAAGEFAGRLRALRAHAPDKLSYCVAIEACALAEGSSEAAEIAETFRDPDYLRVAGRPLVVIHGSPSELSGAVSALRRGVAGSGGEAPFLVVREAAGWPRGADPRSAGLDAVLEDPWAPPIGDGRPSAVFDYRAWALRHSTSPLEPYPRVRNVGAVVAPLVSASGARPAFRFGSKGTYGAWLEIAAEDTRDSFPPGERILFVEGWSEAGDEVVEATRVALSYLPPETTP